MHDEFQSISSGDFHCQTAVVRESFWLDAMIHGSVTRWECLPGIEGAPETVCQVFPSVAPTPWMVGEAYRTSRNSE